MVKKDKRALFSLADKVVLATFFRKTRYPTQREKENLSVQLDKPVAKVTNWFKNERARQSRTEPAHVKIEKNDSSVDESPAENLLNITPNHINGKIKHPPNATSTPLLSRMVAGLQFPMTILDCIHTPVLPICHRKKFNQQFRPMSQYDEILEAQIEEIEKHSNDEEEDVEVCELLNESTDSRPAELINQYGSYFPIIPERNQRVVRRTVITETVEPTDPQRISGRNGWPVQRYTTHVTYPYANSFSC